VILTTGNGTYDQDDAKYQVNHDQSGSTAISRNREVKKERKGEGEGVLDAIRRRV
jgi:hypothetical protein